jgi:hypothetical protein
MDRWQKCAGALYWAVFADFLGRVAMDGWEREGRMARRLGLYTGGGGRKVVTADGLWRTFRGGEMDVRWDEKFELVYKYG